MCEAILEKLREEEMNDEMGQREKDEKEERARRKMEQKRQNRASKKYVDSNAQRCPKCKAPIMKTGG